MKKTMFLIIGIVLLLIGGLWFANNYKTEKKVEEKTAEYGNPYEKTNLHEETIEQLDDPLYQNQIIPKNLDKKLEDNETVTVYFYQPTCGYCQLATPVIVPMAEDLDVDLKKVNLLEYNHNEYWERYLIKSTPTIVHYEEGKEVARIVGNKSEKEFKSFFEEHVIDTE